MDKHPNRGSSLNSCVPRKTFSSLSYNMLFKKIWMIMPSWHCAMLRFVAQSCPTLCDPRDCSLPGSSIRGDSPGKNVGMGCNALLQGIFPIEGSNPGLLHCRKILYCLSLQGSPWTLQWVAYPLSSGSSWPRNQTGVSCTAGGFFTSWATGEAPSWYYLIQIILLFKVVLRMKDNVHRVCNIKEA